MPTMAIDMATAKRGIKAWMAEAVDMQVIWANPSAPQPMRPYASLQMISGPTRISGTDEQITETDLAQVGEEVALINCGLREITISCQIYADKPALGQNAQDLMSLAQAKLGQASVLTKLRTAGVTVVEEGPVQNIDQVESGSFVSRANMDVRFYIASQLEERIGYIKTAEVSSTITGIKDPVSDLVDVPIGDV